MFLPRNVRWLLLGIGLAGLALMLVLRFTTWHTLEAVTLDGKPVENWDKKLKLQPGKSVLDQPLETAAQQLMKDTGTVRVEVAYSLPNELRFTRNRFSPACYVLDSRSGRLFGLNSEARFIPITDDNHGWEHPVITGIRVSGIYHRATDERVTQIVPQLALLAEDNIDLYRLIDEIDMSEQEFVMVTLSGLPYRIKANAAELHRQISGYIQAVEKYPIETESAKVIDLRFDDLIVQKGSAK